MKKIVAVLVWFALASSGLRAASASTSDTATTTQVTLGHSVVALTGPWKFHIGDNPKWADPNFDDAGWETVDLTPKSGAFDPLAGQSGYVPGWTAKGHPGYWGYAWYRIRVRVATRPGEKLALAGPKDVDDVYQVFVNGALLASFGKFSGGRRQPVVYTTRPEMFLLTRLGTSGSNDATPATQVLAFRVWMNPNTLTFEPDPGGLHTAPLLGSASAVAANYQLAWLERIRNLALTPIQAALFLLLAIVSCSLILLDRSDPVYLWLAGVVLLTALSTANECLVLWTKVESAITGQTANQVFLGPLILGGWIMVWWVWFRLRRPAWMTKAIVTLTLLYALSNALGENLFTVVSHPVNAAFHIASLVIRLLFLVLLVLIVIWGIRKQGREGWLALPAVVLLGIGQFQFEFSVLHIRTEWFPLGIGVGIGDIANAALVVVIFALLMRRLLLSLRRQRETALDIKQAQEVQQVLIPENLPHVPGLRIESEYRPAREVGGDFFQIVPDSKDGSVLIIAGDVTGHGLQAGMLVALIVGSIRTAAQYDPDPLRVLQTLNQRLCGRGHAHATCLTLRIAADGAVTLANAGHLPPYLNGKELPMEGALPLGMMEGAEFPVMHFQLEPGDRLMLMSDGIVEAQNEHGHLFGFDRIHDLLQKPITAAELAAAAQNFGQQDDISVLAIAREASTVPSLQPAIQPA